MNIISLESENVKAIKAIRIEPGGEPLVVIGGDNANGKSSLLDSIEMALSGGKAIPTEPIRHGEKRARIVVELDGGMIVTRTFNSKGSQLSIKGGPAGTPQAILNNLVGNLTFDPLEFSRMAPKDRREMLQQIAGLDFSDVDETREKAYTERTNVNRDLKKARAVLDGRPIPAKGLELIDPAEISQELIDALAVGITHDAARHSIEVAEAELKKIDQCRERIRDELRRMDKQEISFTSIIDEHEATLREQLPNTDAIRERLSGAEENNRQVREATALIQDRNERDTLELKTQQLTAVIQACDDSKADDLAEAKYPVDGLGIDDGDATYNGTPYSQISSWEKIKVSVAMGISLNPKLKVMLIHDGSLLDRVSMGKLAVMAREAGTQIWVERVGKGDECTVIIEDGEVVGAVDPKVEALSDDIRNGRDAEEPEKK